MENKPSGVKSEEKLMEQKLKYPLDLQFFAEQAEQNEPTVAAGNSQEQQEPSEPKTFTQEDLNKIISERLGKPYQNKF